MNWWKIGNWWVERIEGECVYVYDDPFLVVRKRKRDRGRTIIVKWKSTSVDKRSLGYMPQPMEKNIAYVILVACIRPMQGKQGLERIEFWEFALLSYSGAHKAAIFSLPLFAYCFFKLVWCYVGTGRHVRADAHTCNQSLSVAKALPFPSFVFLIKLSTAHEHHGAAGPWGNPEEPSSSDWTTDTHETLFWTKRCYFPWM